MSDIQNLLNQIIKGDASKISSLIETLAQQYQAFSNDAQNTMLTADDLLPFMIVKMYLTNVSIDNLQSFLDVLDKIKEDGSEESAYATNFRAVLIQVLMLRQLKNKQEYFQALLEKAQNQSDLKMLQNEIGSFLDEVKQNHKLVEFKKSLEFLLDRGSNLHYAERLTFNDPKDNTLSRLAERHKKIIEGSRRTPDDSAELKSAKLSFQKHQALLTRLIYEDRKQGHLDKNLENQVESLQNSILNSKPIEIENFLSESQRIIIDYLKTHYGKNNQLKLIVMALEAMLKNIPSEEKKDFHRFFLTASTCFLAMEVQDKKEYMKILEEKCEEENLQLWLPALKAQAQIQAKIQAQIQAQIQIVKQKGEALYKEGYKKDAECLSNLAQKAEAVVDCKETFTSFEALYEKNKPVLNKHHGVLPIVSALLDLLSVGMAMLARRHYTGKLAVSTDRGSKVETLKAALTRLKAHDASSQSNPEEDEAKEDERDSTHPTV